MERLIVCQGTAQLVTALAALKQHNQKMEIDKLSRDHLLILGLSVPKEQTIEFAGVIEKMARLLHPFVTINHIEDDDLEYILQAPQYFLNRRFIQLFKTMSGVSQVDEVFVVREWESCNAMVLNAFPKATHICYGDSVGIYLPKNFMAKRPSGLLYAVTWARKLITRCRNLVVKPRLDFSYLLLPNGFGSPTDGKVIRTKSSVLKELFILLTPLILGEKLDVLCKQLFGRNVWILMSSNFSEQGVMSLESEIGAYRDWIRRFAEPDSVLLVKSHPRDSVYKRKMILDSLGDIFSEVIPVDSIGSAYLPVEVLMLHLQPLVQKLHALTVSTACLASYFVVNSDTAIGFGNALVEKYFYPAWIQERIKHEEQLQELINY